MRCIDPAIGLKVLSYDLLSDEERGQVDEHLQDCPACRDLHQKTYGNEGAFAELEYRAFKLSQRQPVQAGAYFLRRLRDLTLPLLAIVVGISILFLWLARRAPDAPRVGIQYLATNREARLDSLSATPMPQLTGGPASVIVRIDRDASVLLYEVGEEFLRRLIPGADTQPPVLELGENHEIRVPPMEQEVSRLLLILAPPAEPSPPDLWDQALMARLSGEGEKAIGWPQGVRATLRWIY